ncbi:MAG: hypothetical protein E6H90_10960 [Chloroflexi bacterium]|nr:MAG: hypothetical protein E6H90_10960 [Chloroflexota bacterium]
MKDSRTELASFFRTINLIGGILVISVIEGFVLQRSRALEFWLLVPNFGLIAVLLVVMSRRYLRYLRAYFRESQAQDPLARWYQRLRYDPTGNQRALFGSLILGGILALTWIAILIARAR